MAQYYTAGGFTIDDTVLPGGNVQWKAPGGNALYSAIGARIWGADVGILAHIGERYPQENLDRIAATGIDVSHIRRLPGPDLHVWVLHEGDGRRQIIYRLDSGSNDTLDPTPEDIPADIASAKAVHICPVLGVSQTALIEHLLAYRKLQLSLDLIVIPDQLDVHTGHHPELWPRLSAFLPSREEVAALCASRTLSEQIAELGPITPPLFTIKLGGRGSIVRDPADGQFWHVPVFPANVLDATGAGDAFCGGFMVGLGETGSPLEAALRGTVSASFVIQDFGGLHALSATTAQAEQRLATLRDGIRRVSLDEIRSW
ncbi:MAG: hypothetical protein IT326_07580 [Anaerolineae bacterium]|nr:hypothetical protein [Anaerolineae bacterium]